MMFWKKSVTLANGQTELHAVAVSAASPLPVTVSGGGSSSTVAIDQTTPGTTNAVDATNLPDTLDVNSGNKSNSTIRVVLATDQPTVPVSGPALSWTQSIVTLTAATSATLIASNASRKGLRWMVTGTNPMTVAPGAVTVVAGNGMNYSAGGGTGQQGGADSFAGDLATQAFSAISTGGTTVVVWEGA